jgi:hypothetical protein
MTAFQGADASFAPDAPPPRRPSGARAGGLARPQGQHDLTHAVRLRPALVSPRAEPRIGDREGGRLAEQGRVSF